MILLPESVESGMCLTDPWALMTTGPLTAASMLVIFDIKDVVLDITLSFSTSGCRFRHLNVVLDIGAVISDIEISVPTSLPSLFSTKGVGTHALRALFCFVFADAPTSLPTFLCMPARLPSLSGTRLVLRPPVRKLLKHYLGEAPKRDEIVTGTTEQYQSAARGLLRKIIGASIVADIDSYAYSLWVTSQHQKPIDCERKIYADDWFGSGRKEGLI